MALVHGPKMRERWVPTYQLILCAFVYELN